MRLRHLLLYTLLSTFTLAVAGGCRKDVEEFRPYPITLGDIALLLGQVPEPATRTVFTMNGAFPDTTLRTASGVRVSLADTEALLEDEMNSPVPCSTCPNLQIEITESLRKGDLLARGLATYDAEGQLFESSGAVRVTFNCGGKKLRVQGGRNIKVQIPAAAPKTDWLMFTRLSKDSTVWQNTQQQAYAADWLGPNATTVKGYELITSTTDWVSAGRPLAAGSATFCADLPPNLNPQNTVVFMIFKKSRAVIQLDKVLSGQNFCAPNLPPSEQVRIVTVSKFGDDFWVSQLEDEIGLSTSVKPMTPTVMSEADILNLLRGL
jgi:hypothetical protein